MSREEFLIKLISLGNIPYIWGGQSVKGFDCSGLAQHVLSFIGLDPVGDQSADALMKHYAKNGINVLGSALKPDLGDLVFFGSPQKSTHVGVCLNETLMIEAGGGDSTCVNENRARQLNAKVKVSEINRRKDVIVILRPNGLPWAASVSAPHKA